MDLQNVYNGCVNTTIVLLDDNYSPDQGNGANGDSNYGTNTLIAPFRQRGILVREGNNRSGSWMINDEVSFDR